MAIDSYINDLEFDFDGFYAQIKALVTARMAKLVKDKEFTTKITFLPLDARNLSKTQTPAITLDISYTPYEAAMDSFQINNSSDVTLQFDVYTSGENAKRNNIMLRSKIAQELIKIQTSGAYRFLGMNIDDNTFVNSIINGVTRGVLRISCVVDNYNKVIQKRRM